MPKALALSLPSGTSRPLLKVLVAGVDKDSRAQVEATVRRAFGTRPPAEPWCVSVVRLAGKWSVTLDGPGDRFRNLSFTADEHRLGPAIGEVIGDGGPRPEPGPAAAGRSAALPQVAPAPVGHGLVQERHACERCQGGILVAYEGRPGEARELAPLACPHCWAVNHFEIGAWAAAGRDYRAEKA